MIFVPYIMVVMTVLFVSEQGGQCKVTMFAMFVSEQGGQGEVAMFVKFVDEHGGQGGFTPYRDISHSLRSDCNTTKKILKIHWSIQKPLSSVLVQMQMGKIGLKHF